MAYFPFQPGQQPMSSSQGVVIASDQSSVMVTLRGGTSSVLVINPNTSVSGTVAATQGTVPWLIGSVYGNISGSVVAFLGGSTNASIITVGGGAGTQYIENAVTPSVTGTAVMFRSNHSSSIMSVVDPVTPLPVTGSVATLQGTNPWVTVGSVYGNIAGSVVAFQGTTPWLTGSVYGNISGSVAAFVVGNASLITIQQASSIVGTYAEDVPSTAADKGLFVLAIRNDTVASLVTGDLDYTGYATDSAGRTITKPFAADDSATFYFQGSIVSGSVALIKASAVGKRSYVTDFFVANSGSVATLVTFKDGSTSILGYTIAPAGGGSNMPGMAIPFRTNPSQDLTFSMSPSASILFVTIQGYQAP